MTVGISIPELKGTMERQDSYADLDRIEKDIKEAPRSCGHQEYLARLMLETVFPYDEFIAVLRMAIESRQGQKVKEAILRLNSDTKERWDRVVEESDDLKIFIQKNKLS